MMEVEGSPRDVVTPAREKEEGEFDHEKTAEIQDYIGHETEKKFAKRILWVFWDSSGKDPETRAYVNRLDCCFLLYTVCVLTIYASYQSTD